MTETCNLCGKTYKAKWMYSTDSRMTNGYAHTLCCNKDIGKR